MGIEEILNTLKESIKMEEDRSIEVFEGQLDEIKKYGSQSVKYLCTVFKDDTDYPGEMYSIVHCIDELYDKDPEGVLKGIAEATPEVFKYAREWLEVLHYRILNTEELIEMYGKVLREVEKEEKEEVIQLLKEIKEEDEDMFGDKISRIIEEIK